MNLERFQAILPQNLGGRTPLTLVVNLTLSDHAESHVSQLNQVTARTDTTMLRDEREYVPVDHLNQKSDQIRMDSRTGLKEGSQAGDHRRLDIDVLQRFSGTCGMASDDVVLEIGQILVIHPPLRHRAETGVDAVDHFLGGELLQKLIASLDLFHRKVRQLYIFVFEYYILGPFDPECEFPAHILLVLMFKSECKNTKILPK